MGYGSDSVNGVSVINVNVENPYKQSDFVKLLQDHNQVANQLYVKVNGDRDFDVMIPFKGNTCAQYNFKKGINDDYIHLARGRVSLLQAAKTLDKNYDSNTGTWTTTAVPNYYTTLVGATFTFAFTGTGFDFRHFGDTRGGVWEFVIDSDTANKITVTTWSATVLDVVSQVKRGLTLGSHSVVATFKGDDPLNAPSSGVGTARGWVSFNAGAHPGKETIAVYDENQLNPLPQYEVYGNGSNCEFAFSLKPVGQTTEYFVPDHGTGTAFAAVASDQSVYFDDQLITSWTADTISRKVQSVKIIQKVNAMYPSDPSPMATIYSVHTISARGVSVKVKVKFLRQLYTSSSYGMMFPGDSTFGKKFLTSYGTWYDSSATDGSTVDITENDKAISYAYINSGGATNLQNTMIAMTIQNIEKTLRYGASNRRAPTVLWLQHRNTTMQKLYPQTYINTTINAGETYEIGGTYFIGELPLAESLLTL